MKSVYVEGQTEFYTINRDCIWGTGMNLSAISHQCKNYNNTKQQLINKLQKCRLSKEIDEIQTQITMIKPATVFENIGKLRIEKYKKYNEVTVTEDDDSEVQINYNNIPMEQFNCIMNSTNTLIDVDRTVDFILDKETILLQGAAGAGKSYLLMKIVQKLEQLYGQSDSILLLTPTNKACANMNEKDYNAKTIDSALFKMNPTSGIREEIYKYSPMPISGVLLWMKSFM